MPALVEMTTANSYTLYGGAISGKIVIQSFDNLEINLETTDNASGTSSRGLVQGPLASTKSFGEPTFATPLAKGDMTLWNWWKSFYPCDGSKGVHVPEDIYFNFAGSKGEIIAEWVLKGAFPKKYQISSAGATESKIATETFTLCITEVTREQ